jgi:hypothetical protein
MEATKVQMFALDIHAKYQFERKSDKTKQNKTKQNPTK